MALLYLSIGPVIWLLIRSRFRWFMKLALGLVVVPILLFSALITGGGSKCDEPAKYFIGEEVRSQAVETVASCR